MLALDDAVFSLQRRFYQQGLLLLIVPTRF